MLQLLQSKDFPYLSCNSYFININDCQIIIDTGNYFLRNELLKNLAMNNIIPDKINYVINTHLHFDHCGNNEIFPNAQIIVPTNELDFIDLLNQYDQKASLIYLGETYPLIPEDKLKNFLRMIKAHKKPYDWLFGNMQRITIIEKDIELFPEVNLIFNLGHSPGHISLLYLKDNICFCGDIMDDVKNDTPGATNVNFVVKDYYQLKESRLKLLDSAETFYPGHGKYIYNNRS